MSEENGHDRDATAVVDILGGDFLGAFEERQLAPIDATPTPLPSWNRHCGDDGGRVGIGRGWFVTIGGNPGFGKSLFALNVAARAIRNRESVGFVSLEMSRHQLAARFYAIATGTNIQSIEKGDGFSTEGFRRVRDKLHRASVDSMMAGLMVADRLYSIGEILRTMEAMRQATCRWFVLDYLQLAGAGSEEDIYRQVTEVATEVRRFAHENECTVLGLSQFNRRTSADYSQTPRCQGLHGGMPLEANSDQVILLDHSRYERDTLNPKLARTWVVIDKNRHGGQGAIPVLWDYRTLQVREAEPDEESSWPVHNS